MERGAPVQKTRNVPLLLCTRGPLVLAGVLIHPKRSSNHVGTLLWLEFKRTSLRPSLSCFINSLTQPSTMASTVPNLHPPSLKSTFLGRAARLHKPSVVFPKHGPSTIHSRPCAKFDLSEILGGRGICNGEKGIEQELKRTVEEPALSSGGEKPAGVEETFPPSDGGKSAGDVALAAESIPEDAFDKELMGMTGGFPGGEKGLQSFIEKNPPPPKKSAEKVSAVAVPSLKKPKAPELPLLMPGMIALVKNPNNPYYMYCGIVQRITDGKAGVLFEGGNWDRLITFNLDELERREKGPPMKNPRSVIIENLLEKEP